MFQFELLTKRDWALVVILAVLIALALGGGIYLLGDYTGVSLSADQGKLGRY